MFGGGGTPADPGTLLTSSPGERARVSVVSLIGLPTDGARQGFVNQLQVGLHNRIPGNGATHFFGRFSMPIQIEAAREMARVKDGDVPDIGNLMRRSPPARG